MPADGETVDDLPRTGDGGVRTVSGDWVARIRDPPAGSDRAKACPVCGERGRRVTALTVTAHLRPEFWKVLGDGFWFCWTRDCPIFYYDNGRGLYVSKGPREVRTRFGLKETEAPRPICYCLGVNAETIFDEVEHKGCCDSLGDVERYTRAGTGKWCVTTNPSGVCCRAYLKEIVEESLARASTTARQPVTEVAEKLAADETPGVPMRLKVGGMDCEACGVAVTGLIEHEGGRNVRVSVVDGRALLDLPKGTDAAKLLTALADAGYSSEPAD
jgi:copper chaperone CopZ